MKKERNKIYVDYEKEKLKLVRRKHYGQVIKELASLGPTGDIYRQVGQYRVKDGYWQSITDNPPRF